MACPILLICALPSLWGWGWGREHKWLGYVIPIFTGSTLTSQERLWGKLTPGRLLSPLREEPKRRQARWGAEREGALPLMAQVRPSLFSRTSALSRRFSAPLQTLPSGKYRCFWSPTRRSRRVLQGAADQATRLASMRLVTARQPPDLSSGLPAQCPFCSGSPATPR